ncbi:MAG: polysaccharide biosynthesis/export family protein [Acidobacteria bacterium]|nr:polysaccharide biosynthesis/export family protein [Acidobacteriota bacterium]
MKIHRSLPWKCLPVVVIAMICCLLLHPLEASDGDSGKRSMEGQGSKSSLPDYRFVPGDTVEVKFFYNPDMNEAVRIRPDGKIALSLIGDVDLNGKSVAAASRLIEELYAPHLKTPQVTIQIRNYAAQKVYVGGEVLRPGVVDLSYELTLLNALMEAGGVKNTGSNKEVLLIRKTPENTPQLMTIPFREKDGSFTEQAMTLLLRPYDVVILPESKITKVNRWVDQYIRQVVPFNLNAGFTYLLNPEAYY